MSFQLLDLAAEAVTEYHHSRHGPTFLDDDMLIVEWEARPSWSHTWLDVHRAPLTLIRGVRAYSDAEVSR